MALAFDPTYPFLGVLLVYMVYSEWAHLDSRYLLGAALLLLVITAVVDAVGAVSDANVLAVYVFYLLGGGVLLLLVDHVREERARARSPRRKPKAPGTTRPSGGTEITTTIPPAEAPTAAPASAQDPAGTTGGTDEDQTNSSKTLSIPASPAF